MTAGKYLKDKILELVTNGMGVFLLSLYLLAVKNSWTTVFLIAVVWLVVFFILLYADYRNRKRYFDKIDDLMEHLDQPYLVQEFLGTSWKLEDGLYKEILHRSNKAVIEQIYQLEEAKIEYREKSTEIGLYLCKKLCRKLEIDIGVDSVENEYTEVFLIFPKNSYLSIL